jgi:CsoR family transcriptional regulator, copper-sensing transcriptional repressor
MPGYVSDKAEIVDRLKRVEGQVRGIQRMVEAEQYCIDVLTQISAASSGLKRVAVALLNDHLDHCVAEAMQGSDAERSAKVSEATAAIDRLLKA